MPAGVVLIGGSTASGKSALALALAERTGGVILNADSVQVYKDLPILTARPDPADLARAEHRLYGILEATEPSSVVGWLARIEPELDALARAGRLAIVTGGTGLYFKALLEGLPEIPDIPPALRAELRASTVPSEQLHAELAHLDPALARSLAPADRQRILRGLEVVHATGRPLSAWQAEPSRRIPLAGPRAGIALLPPASVVDPRIARRLEMMLEAGLLAELSAFHAKPGSPTTSLAKACGATELLAHLDGRLDLATAKALTIQSTRRYAKRQRTFFKRQLAQAMPAHQNLAYDALADRLLAALA